MPQVFATRSVARELVSGGQLPRLRLGQVFGGRQVLYGLPRQSATDGLLRSWVGLVTDLGGRPASSLIFISVSNNTSNSKSTSHSWMGPLHSFLLPLLFSEIALHCCVMRSIITRKPSEKMFMFFSPLSHTATQLYLPLSHSAYFGVGGLFLY